MSKKTAFLYKEPVFNILRNNFNCFSNNTIFNIYQKTIKGVKFLRAQNNVAGTKPHKGCSSAKVTRFVN
jgi:hypothetical protein